MVFQGCRIRFCVQNSQDLLSVNSKNFLRKTRFPLLFDIETRSFFFIMLPNFPYTFEGKVDIYIFYDGSCLTPFNICRMCFYFCCIFYYLIKTKKNVSIQNCLDFNATHVSHVPKRNKRTSNRQNKICCRAKE